MFNYFPWYPSLLCPYGVPIVSIYYVFLAKGAV